MEEQKIIRELMKLLKVERDQIVERVKKLKKEIEM